MAEKVGNVAKEKKDKVSPPYSLMLNKSLVVALGWREDRLYKGAGEGRDAEVNHIG
jgi:hypothetical protein